MTATDKCLDQSWPWGNGTLWEGVTVRRHSWRRVQVKGQETEEGGPLTVCETLQFQPSLSLLQSETPLSSPCSVLLEPSREGWCNEGRSTAEVGKDSGWREVGIGSQREDKEAMFSRRCCSYKCAWLLTPQIYPLGKSVSQTGILQGTSHLMLAIPDLNLWHN